MTLSALYMTYKIIKFVTVTVYNCFSSYSQGILDRLLACPSVCGLTSHFFLLSFSPLLFPAPSSIPPPSSLLSSSLSSSLLSSSLSSSSSSSHSILLLLVHLSSPPIFLFLPPLLSCHRTLPLCIDYTADGTHQSLQLLCAQRCLTVWNTSMRPSAFTLYEEERRREHLA